MSEKKYVLGLDISTTTIGVALFEDFGDFGELRVLEHVTPKVKKKDATNIEKLFIKADIFYDAFIDKYIDYNITRVIIEEPLLRSNNVNTVGTLLRFNGILSKMVFDKFGIIPEYISSYDSRKYAFPELMAVRTINTKGEPYTEKEIQKRIKNNETVLFGAYPTTIDKKVVIWEKINELDPKIQWIYNKKGELTKENYDMSDAYCCLIGYMKKNEIWK